MKIDSVEEKDGVVTVTGNNAAESFVVNDETTYSPYLTKNIVTLRNLQAGSRIMVWYAFSVDGEEQKARHIMLLPELAEDTDQVMTRADFIALLHTAQGSPVVNYAMNFSDVAQDADYAEAVRWAVSEGFVGGTAMAALGRMISSLGSRLS